MAFQYFRFLVGGQSELRQVGKCHRQNEERHFKELPCFICDCCAKGGAIHGPRKSRFQAYRSASLAHQVLAVWLNESFIGAAPKRCPACVTALLQKAGFSGEGSAESSVASTSGIDWCRYSTRAITSHTTCSAGSRRRRILAVTVALSACSIHANGSQHLIIFSIACVQNKNAVQT